MTDYGDFRRAARGAADAGVLVPPVVVAADATALTLTLTPPAGARQAYVLLRRSAPGAQWESVTVSCGGAPSGRPWAWRALGLPAEELAEHHALALTTRARARAERLVSRLHHSGGCL